MWKNLKTHLMWTIPWLAIVAIAGMSLTLGASQKAAGKSPEPRSVWDGVYTEDQAKRGEPLYYRDCSSCHGEKLQGDDNSPALAGTDFVTDWDGLTLGKLFDKIRLTMPRDGPSQISNPEKADILAYILSVNKFPAGKTELQQGDPLKEIRFEAAKPGKTAGSKSGDR